MNIYIHAIDIKGDHPRSGVSGNRKWIRQRHGRSGDVSQTHLTKTHTPETDTYDPPTYLSLPLLPSSLLSLSLPLLFVLLTPSFSSLPSPLP